MKGQTKILETILAILIMSGAYILLFAGQQSSIQTDTLNWKLLTLNALSSLDQKNELRSYVLANDTASIQNELSSTIPEPLTFSVVICGLNCPQPTLPPVDVASVDYLISGDFNNITNKQVFVYVWFGESR